MQEFLFIYIHFPESHFVLLQGKSNSQVLPYKMTQDYFSIQKQYRKDI